VRSIDFSSPRGTTIGFHKKSNSKPDCLKYKTVRASGTINLAEDSKRAYNYGEECDHFVREMDDLYERLRSCIIEKQNIIFSQQHLCEYLNNLKNLTSGTLNILRDMKEE